MSKMKKSAIYFTIIFLGISTSLISQPLSTSSKRAIQMYDLATRSIDSYDYQAAVVLLKEALRIDSKFTEAWLLMADAYDFMGKYDSVVYASENALKVGGEKYPVIFFFCSQAYFKVGSYEKALEMAKIFLEKRKYSANQEKQIRKIINNCQFALEALKYPVSYTITRMDDSINSPYDEYWPSLSADEEVMVFTRLIPRNELNTKFWGNWQEDIFVTQKKGNYWSTARSIGNRINTIQNEGSESITADGMKMYYTACNREDGKGKCDIYVSELTPNGWTEGVNIGEPINTGNNEKQPSLSADGRTMYFVSNRPGGKGKYDVWISHLQDNGKWSVPVNAGDSINTPDDEQSPFIHPDNQTLYFSSDGWTGMGGYDIFVSRKICAQDTCWKTPVNLGYPLNTSADEIGFTVNARGDRGLFASDRGYAQKKDIFEIIMPITYRPLAVSYIKGKIYDAETLQPLEANLELVDLESREVIHQSFSQKNTGEFLVCIPVSHQLAFNISKDRYMFYSEHFALYDTLAANKPFLKDFALQPIKPGKKTILNNIFFETNSYELKKESEVELNKLISFLQANPQVKIEIMGHTDNSGSEIFNLTLSENRARSVARYLIQNGIDAKRIFYKGYGEKFPIASNDTEQGKAMNRRTEFKIIE
ncbi:MAG: OmpA family protein [Bacteroidales bacterium]|nr:OmpA family protein [Bacteroidales bacterium]